MKKLINAPETMLSEALAGFVETHAELVRYDAACRVVFRREAKPAGRVALVAGGGSGHEPMHIGYVGPGMLDAACAGRMFTSPTPDQILAAAAATDTGAGVLFIVKNYAGDIMNFEMAADMYAGRSATVLIDDDVALLDGRHRSGQGRRGVAGTVIAEKIIGAAAERGASLAECQALGEAVAAATGTLAVALSGCTVPEAGTPTFSLGADEIELGVGIHGEAGQARGTMMTADALARLFLGRILAKLAPQPEDPLLLMCNGLGSTPPLELYTFYHAARRQLDAAGHRVARSLVGTYCTALDMAGASLTVTRLNPHLLSLWDAPAQTPALRWCAAKTANADPTS